MKPSCYLGLAALLLSSVLPARATTNYPVDAGATRMVDLGKSHNPETNPNSGGGAQNLCNFQLGIGSTLKLTDSGSAASVTFSSSFEFRDTTGTTSVTLDLTELKGKPFNMEGNIYLADVAKLVIKGTNTFTFGHVGNIWPTYYPIFKVGHLEFQDKDGNVQPGKVVFTGQMIAFLIPDGWVRGTDYELTPGMELGVHENALHFPANGTIDLGPDGLNCDLAIVDTMESDVAGGTHANFSGVSIPPSSTVVVPTGRTLVFNLQAYNPTSKVTESLYPAAGNRVFFGIDLRGGTIKVTERNNLVHTGALTGYGKIVDGWSVSGANRGIRQFNGPCEFTGTGLEVDYSRSLYNSSNDSYARLYLANVKNGSVLKSLNLGTQGHAEFAICGPTWTGLTGPAMNGHVMRYGSDGYWRIADGADVDFTGFEPGSGATYTVTNGQSVIGGASASQVDIEAGSAVEVVAPGASRMAINVKADAKATLLSFPPPFLWVDASIAGTVSNLWIKANTPQEGPSGKALAEQYCRTTGGQPLVAQWHDVRGTSAYKLWSDRYDKPIAANVNSLYPHTHPYVAADGPNGMSYISFCGTSGNNIGYALEYADGTSGTKFSNMSRLFFYKADYVFNPASTAGGNQTVRPRYVVMVFGAQGGGGHGLVAGANFYRATANTAGPIYDETDANKSLRAWVDGRAVNPRASDVLKSGWQIVTLEIGGLNVDGLGFGKNSAGDNGGQRYAEVLLFDRDLTDSQRQTVEIYLAEKWGLKDAYSYPATRPVNVASLYGEGRVTVDSDGLTLGGAFKGTIDLNGRTATVDGAALPPDPSAVATEGLLGWFDPDDPQSLQTQEIRTAMPTTRLNYINDRQGTSEGRFVMHSQDASRAAGIDVSAHGLGPVRTWIDYANYPGDNVGVTGRNGNLTRLKQYDASGSSGGQVVMEGVRTLMIVQDSRRGGGQPFFDSKSDVNTDNGNYKFRTQYRSGATGDKEASFVGKAWVWSPIYPAGCSSVLTAGSTYLNGIPVNGTKQGFTGRPEVLTVQTSAAYPLRSFGSLHNSEGTNLLGDDKSAGEIEGEIILWNRTLNEEERKAAEAYLSYKWLGLVREGYSALGDATVTGAGTLNAASVTLLPKFARDFVGTVKVTGADGFSFQLNTENRVTDLVKAVDLGGGTLDVSGDVAVTVTALGERPREGEYRLVGWSAAPTDVNWSLRLAGLADANRTSCRLMSRDDGLYLIVEPFGLYLIFR